MAIKWKKVLGQLPRDLIDLALDYLPHNELKYFHGKELSNYADLSEEQLLSITTIIDHDAYVHQAVALQSTRAFRHWDWTNFKLEQLVDTIQVDFSTTMMDYVWDTIFKLPRGVLATLQFQNLFDTEKCECQEAVEWYREHGLWSGKEIDNAFKQDNANWFESLCTNYWVWTDRVINSRKLNILLLMASEIDLTPHVNRIFNSYFSVDDLQQIYDTMRLTTSQPLSIGFILNDKQLPFQLSHFTITDTLEHLLHIYQHCEGCDILLFMHFKQPIVTSFEVICNCSEEIIKQVYSYDPTLFQIDISTVYMSLAKFRLCISFGSYITVPIIDTNVPNSFEEKDYVLDETLDQTLVDQKINQLLESDNMMMREKSWLTHSLLRRIPHPHWKFNRLLFICSHCDPRIYERLDWTCMDYQLLMKSFHFETLFQFMNPLSLLMNAIQYRTARLDDIAARCYEKNPQLVLDALFLKLHWNALSDRNREVLFVLFPQACDGLQCSSKEFGILKRLKLK